MATPPKAELKDYVWCVGCSAYVPKRLLRKNEGFMFASGELACPDGHTELQDVTAEPNPAPHAP